MSQHDSVTATATVMVHAEARLHERGDRATARSTEAALSDA